MTKYEVLESKNINMLHYSVSQLCALFNETNNIPMTQAVATVRGWIMDALEAKDPDAMNDWMENHYDMDDPTPLFIRYN